METASKIEIWILDHFCLEHKLTWGTFKEVAAEMSNFMNSRVDWTDIMYKNLELVYREREIRRW